VSLLYAKGSSLNFSGENVFPELMSFFYSLLIIRPALHWKSGNLLFPPDRRSLTPLRFFARCDFEKFCWDRGTTPLGSLFLSPEGRPQGGPPGEVIFEPPLVNPLVFQGSLLHLPSFDLPIFPRRGLAPVPSFRFPFRYTWFGGPFVCPPLVLPLKGFTTGTAHWSRAWLLFPDSDHRKPTLTPGGRFMAGRRVGLAFDLPPPRQGFHLTRITLFPLFSFLWVFRPLFPPPFG